MVEEIQAKKIDGTIVTVPEGVKSFLILDGKIIGLEEVGKVYTKLTEVEETPPITTSVREPEYPTISKVVPPVSLHLLPTPEEVSRELKELEEIYQKHKLTEEQKQELKRALEFMKDELVKAARVGAKEFREVAGKAKSFMHYLHEHLKRKEKLKEEVV